MSNDQIEKVLKGAKRSMEIEGFTIDGQQEETVRKILKGELDKETYFASIREKARSYAYEV